MWFMPNTHDAASNKALILSFYEEVWNKGNVAFAHQVFAEDYQRHDLRPTQALPGPSGQEKVASDFRQAFPDIHYRIDLAIAEDDLVCLRWTATGTMMGDWANVKATGKKLEYSGVNIFRFKNGKVVEIWNHRDDLGVAQQMGAPVYAGATGR
ncbi:ester cyclase [Aestuariivirga litoralis]|nr:ester cyclase [Aestuariivirga litoralis]